MALALSLALLAGCGYRTMPAQGEEPAPGGASSAVETAPGGETAMPAQTPEEGVRAVCRVVDGGAEGALILAGLYLIVDSTVLPTITQRIKDMFDYAG